MSDVSAHPAPGPPAVEEKPDGTGPHGPPRLRGRDAVSDDRPPLPPLPPSEPGPLSGEHEFIGPQPAEAPIIDVPPADPTPADVPSADPALANLPSAEPSTVEPPSADLPRADSSTIDPVLADQSPSDPPAPTPLPAQPLTAEERAELELLRREVELAKLERLRLLQADLAAVPKPPARSRHLGRTIPAVLLIVLACVLAPLSVVAVWADDFVVNTDRYVATVGPLATDPTVQTAVTDQVTTLITQQVDLPSLVNSVAGVLPDNGIGSSAASALKALTGPIVGGVTDFIHGTVAKVVASPAFATAWTQLNRTAHASAVKALTGQGGGAVQLKGNDVTIDLAPVIEQVKSQLVASGFGLAANIPIVHTSFTVLSSDAVPQVKTGFRLLQIAGNWLPVVAVLLGAAGIALALRHRNALIGASVGVAVGMLVLGIVLAVGRSMVLGQLPANVSEPAAVVVIDAVLDFLWVTIRTVAVLAVLVALGAYLDGPSRPAVWIRGTCASGLAGIRSLAGRVGLDPGPVGPCVHRFHRWLAWVVLAVAALVFALWPDPTVAVVLWAAVVVLIALAVLEFLDVRGPARLPE